MKKFVVATGALLAVATSMPFISTATAYADTTSQATTSHQTQANQNLLQQIKALQSQIDKEHDTYLKDELHKALQNYHDDLAKNQSARGELKAAIRAYEQAVKQDKGHDDGTIVRTVGEVHRVLATVKDSLQNNMHPEQSDIRQAQKDIQNHQLQQAVNDIRKADARVKNETGVFEKASAALTQIVKDIVKSADTSSSTSASGSVSTGSTSDTSNTSGTNSDTNSTASATNAASSNAAATN